MNAVANATHITTIRNDVFVAQISAITAGVKQLFHYAVRRKDTEEVIHSGRAASMQKAFECIGEFFEERGKKIAVLA